MVDQYWSTAARAYAIAAVAAVAGGDPEHVFCLMSQVAEVLPLVAGGPWQGCFVIEHGFPCCIAVVGTPLGPSL